MAKETVFSCIKRIFGEYVSAIDSKYGKRDDDKSIFVQHIYKIGLAMVDVI